MANNFSKLQQIEDYYIDLGYKREKLRKALTKDKEYKKLLKDKKQKIITKAKVSPLEKRKYVLSTESDLEILMKCKQLEKLKLNENDQFLVKFIKTQLEADWRKYLLIALNKLIKKYEK